VASTIPPQSDTLGFSAGYRISGYRLEQQIGRGGMAVVFGAYDERLERQVALKILAPVMAQDEAFRQRFIAESRAAAAVEDPHIIPIYEAGEADGVLFIAMRLVPGGDLRTLVAEHGPLAPARAEWILSAVASALDSAHACGLVHRDVKPANMLLDVRPGRPDHVYLTDFGVSKASVSAIGLTGHGQFVGTVDYAAPEQILGQPVDGRADQYALGCAAFELLCGHPPYSGKELPAVMYSHLSAPPPAATAERPDLPAAVDSVFARVLAKSPADRYGSCQEFAGALRAALGLKTYSSGDLAAPDHASAEPESTAGATLDPAAANGFASQTARPDGAGTDPRATSSLTAGGNGVARARLAGRMLLSGAAAVILLAGVAAAVVLSRPHAQSPASYSYPFPSQSYAGGLSITQLWTLTGRDGSLLRVSMTVSNVSAKPVTAQLAEPILDEGTFDHQSVKFSRVKPVATSPLAVWDLRLPSGGSKVVSYQVLEPASGLSYQQLMAYVGAYIYESRQQELQVLARPSAAFTRLSVMPYRLRLTVGHYGRLTARGRLASGRLATRADLTGAVWTTADSGVVFVSRSGRVTALSRGTAVVYVQIGHIRAQAIVIVSGNGQAPPPPAVYKSPPVHSSKSASPSPTTAVSSPPATSPPSSPPPTGTPPPASSPPPSGTPTPTQSDTTTPG
jgi:serine/threonine protein kinase